MTKHDTYCMQRRITSIVKPFWCKNKTLYTCVLLIFMQGVLARGDDDSGSDERRCERNEERHREVERDRFSAAGAYELLRERDRGRERKNEKQSEGQMVAGSEIYSNSDDESQGERATGASEQGDERESEEERFGHDSSFVSFDSALRYHGRGGMSGNADKGQYSTKTAQKQRAQRGAGKGTARSGKEQAPEVFKHFFPHVQAFTCHLRAWRPYVGLDCVPRHRCLSINRH